MANKANLHINQIEGLVDDDGLIIRVTELKPFEPITLSSLTKEGVKRFGAVAHYLADKNGEVDTSSHHSVGGDFVGIEPFGLIWAMDPLSDQRFGTRLVHQNVETPVVLKISVYREHLSVADVLGTDALATGEIRRSYKDKSVRRVKIREGRLRGSFFVPAGDGPFPGVIDIFGTAGGLMEHRAALLASHGFAVLSLAYFAYEDLPKTLDVIDVDYFEEAVDWILKQNVVKSEHGVGFVGVSKGAEIISVLTEFCPKVTAAVIINGHSHLVEYDSMKSGRCVKPASKIDITKIDIDLCRDKKTCSYRWTDLDSQLEPRDETSLLKPEVSQTANYLYLVSGFDLSNSPDKTLRSIQRLIDAGKTNYELLLLPGAGHLLEPPHSPLCRYCYTKLHGVVVDYGGVKSLHARAQERAWRRTISFLKENLSPETTITKSKL